MNLQYLVASSQANKKSPIQDEQKHRLFFYVYEILTNSLLIDNI